MEGLVSCLSGGWKGLMDAVVFERLKAVVLSPTLLVSEVTVPPDAGLKACARSRPTPPPRVPWLLSAWLRAGGRPPGLWERISGPGLASPWQKLLIKDIPGMTEPSVQDAPHRSPAHAHRPGPHRGRGRDRPCDVVTSPTRRVPRRMVARLPGGPAQTGSEECGEPGAAAGVPGALAAPPSGIAAAAACSGTSTAPLRGPGLELTPLSAHRRALGPFCPGQGDEVLPGLLGSPLVPHRLTTQSLSLPPRSVRAVPAPP